MQERSALVTALYRYPVKGLTAERLDRIALTAGVSRLFSPVGFLLTIALAVSPVPLAVLIFGRQVLGG